MHANLQCIYNACAADGSLSLPERLLGLLASWTQRLARVRCEGEEDGRGIRASNSRPSAVGEKTSIVRYESGGVYCIISGGGFLCEEIASPAEYQSHSHHYLHRPGRSAQKFRLRFLRYSPFPS
jgi:hypothetical protein